MRHKLSISPLVFAAVVLFFSQLHVSSQANLAHAQDATAGQASYQICKACHGPNGAGQQMMNAPALAGQFDWYLVRQLQHLKAGIRGAHAKDTYGAQMRAMAMTLPDENAMANVAAYIQTLPSPTPKSTLGGDATNGKDLYLICSACHGQSAEGNTTFQAPRLNTQHDWYLLRQLQNFKTGVRGKHAEDIYGAQMQIMATILADETAMQDVIAYIKSLAQ